MKILLPLSLTSLLFLSACGGGSGGSDANSHAAPVVVQTIPNQSNSENTDAHSEQHTEPVNTALGLEMQQQAEQPATREYQLDYPVYKKGGSFIFGGDAAKLAYKDYLHSASQNKTYVANIALCNGQCDRDDVEIKTAQIQFNIVPTAEGTLKVENLLYRQLDENKFNLYTVQQPLQPLMNSNVVTESTIQRESTLAILDADKRIFTFSLAGDVFKGEVNISNLKLAFSPNGQWFTSMSQDVFVAGTRLDPDRNGAEVSRLVASNDLGGVSFNLDGKMVDDLKSYYFESYKHTYMIPKRFRSRTNQDAEKHGLFTPIGHTNSFGFGYSENGKEFSLNDNPVYQSAGIFVVDPSENFAIGVESRRFTQNVNILLQP